MENRDKILTIGDIHGRNSWKEIIFGGMTEFWFWKESVINDYEEMIKGEYNFHQYKKIIFVGDYVDSYDVSNVDILENLEDIVLFAKTYPDLVVLILGNHDVQYIVSNECCSGYRAEMRPDLNRIFKDNEDLFVASYFDVESNTLWTHAGVTDKWYKECLRDVNLPNYRLNDFFIGSENWRIDKFINMLWKLRVSNFFNVDYASGGTDLWAGPIWVRPDILKEYCIEGLNQIVGHTPQKEITEVCPLEGVESNKDKLSKLIFVDVLANSRTPHILKTND